MPSNSESSETPTPAILTVVETRSLFPNVRDGRGKWSSLSHAVEVNGAGDVVRVLCGRAKPENVEERAGMLRTEHDAPTCKACLARDPRSFPVLNA